MKYAEVVFEDGSPSIVSYDDESELRSFLEENHRRAVNGEPSAAQEMYARSDLSADDFDGRMPTVDQLKSRPAFRVKRVYLYDKHPADAVPVGNEGTMPVKVSAVEELVTGMASGGDEVNMHQLVQALRDEASPVHTVKQGKWDSIYKASATGELDLSFLNDGDANA